MYWRSTLALSPFLPCGYRASQPKHCYAQVSYARQEGRRHLLRSPERTMQDDEQICGRKVYERQLQKYRAGDKDAGDSGIAKAVPSPKHRQTSGSSLRSSKSEVVFSLRVDGDECLRAYPRVPQPLDGRSDKGLDVSACESHGSHAPQWDFPSRCKAGKHPHNRGHAQADFGSCRAVYSKHPYTEYISTRWYRAPECLLTDGYYTYKMDMWGVGCVIFEIVSLFPLFPGKNELDQIQKIHKILGTPPQALLDKMKAKSRRADFNFPSQVGTGIAHLIPHASAACIELVNKLLAYDPSERMSAREALAHIYFKDIREKDQLQEAFCDASRSHYNSIWDSSSKPMAQLNAMNMKKHPLDFTRIYATNRNSTSSLDFLSRISQLPTGCTNTSRVAKEDENDVTKSRSDFEISPRPERKVLAIGQHECDTLDVTPAEECRQGDANTKNLAANFPSLLPRIKNGCENTRLQQDHAKTVAHRSSQNLKILKGGARVTKPAQASLPIPELVRKSTEHTHKPVEPSQQKKRITISKVPATLRSDLRRQPVLIKTPKEPSFRKRLLNPKRLMPQVTKKPEDTYSKASRGATLNTTKSNNRMQFSANSKLSTDCIYT